MSDDVIVTVETMTKWRDGYKIEGWTQRVGVLMVFDSHEALRARCEQAERERDGERTAALRWASEAGAYARAADAAEARVRELMEALREYGRHTNECAFRWDMIGRYDHPRDCTCGLDAVLGEQEAAPQPEHNWDGEWTGGPS